MAVSEFEVQIFATAKLAEARKGTPIALSEEGKVLNREKYAKAQHTSIGELPALSGLQHGFGEVRWASILFVDLRDSTLRAEMHGAKMTYVTMHVYLPTMAYLVKEYGGYVVGLRGDGLFAAFGIDETGNNPKDLDYNQTVQDSMSCGKAMIEAVDDIIGPLLANEAMESNVENFTEPVIGCGIDADRVVLTRIGLFGASEVTAYGTAVNKAAKLSGSHSQIGIGQATKGLIPTSKNGKLRFNPHPGVKGAFLAQYPDTYRELVG